MHKGRCLRRSLPPSFHRYQVDQRVWHVPVPSSSTAQEVVVVVVVCVCVSVCLCVALCVCVCVRARVHVCDGCRSTSTTSRGCVQALKYIAESITAADVPPIMTQVYAKSGVNGCLDFLFNLTKPSIAKYFLDELQGQADGSGLDLALFHRVAMLGELTKMGCSMIGAWGPAVSRTSGLVQLRALDWDTDGPFQAYPVVLVRHPSGGGQNAFATVGWAGDVGAITGYSSAGVGISEKVWIHYAGKSSWSGTPTTFALRDILQFSTDLDGAIAHVREINRTNSIFIGVGSKKDGQFRALEYAHDNVTVWSDSTGPDYGNHTRRPGLVYVDKHTQPDPGQGAWCLDTLMAQHYGHLDAASIVEQIAPVYQTGDSQVVVYDFQRDYMYVTYPSVSGWPSHRLNVTKAYDRPSTRFDMAALFAEPNDTK